MSNKWYIRNNKTGTVQKESQGRVSERTLPLDILYVSKISILFFKRQYWSVIIVIKSRDDDATSKKIKIGFEDDEEYVGRLQQLITKTVLDQYKGDRSVHRDTEMS